MELIIRILLALFLIVNSVKTSNIDTDFPVIIKNTADGPNSLFGTTVVLVKDKNNSPGIIVGAPRANSTLQNHEKIFEPGVLWQCSLEKKSQACRVLEMMDSTGNVPDSSRENITDRKDGTWLGGSMTINNDNFITCGSRWANQFYEKKDNKYYMNGICYWRPRKEIFEEELPELSQDSRLLPLTEYVHQSNNFWSLGQAGFSVHISQKGNEMIIGAPGIAAWKGSVIKYSSGDNFGKPFTKALVASPSDSLQLNSYFGFVVASGNFFKRGGKKIQYVSGAPRGNNLAGEVVIFQFPDGNDQIEKLQQINGNQIGSYFGSSLCVADLNGDGYDDLLIGAPQYSTEFRMDRKQFGNLGQQRSFGGRAVGYGDEGAVFIYLSNKELSLNPVPNNLFVNGRNRAWAHFGTAITNLGDINKDGYDDIAIGAPFDLEGAGIVFIYHGGENGLSKSYKQMIRGKDIDINLRGFGYSLSEGADIDNNGYNDLAVGAFDSGHVVILRSSPFITVLGDVRSDMTRIPLDTTTFDVKSCVSYRGDTSPDKLDLKVRLMIDVETRPPRVLLQIPKQNSAAEHTYEEVVYNGASESCTTFKAIVSRPLESSGKPIVIKQEVSIAEKDSVSGPTVYDIRRFGGQVSTNISGKGFNAFCKNCPLLNPSTTKLKQLQLPLAVLCGDDEKCVADLRLDVKFLERSVDAPFVIGSSPTLTMEVKVSNLVETAIAPAVIISWKSRNLKKIPPECQSQYSNETFSSLKCSMGQILEESQSKTVVLEFEMSDLVAGSQEELWIHIQSITASDIVDHSKSSLTIVIPLIAQADIFIEGSTSLGKFNPATLSPKTTFFHTYEITLEGPSSIAGASAKFHIPVSFKTPSSSQTAIQVHEPNMAVTMGAIHCQATKGSFAPNVNQRKIQIDIKEEEISDMDLLEEKNEDAILPAGLGLIIGKKSGTAELKIDCSSAAVECMEIACHTEKFSPGVKGTITFRVSIVSSSLSSVFKRNKVTAVKIISEGSVTILNYDGDIQPTSHKPDNAIAITTIELESAMPVANWIWGVGILFGFLILGLIVYCLYNCGVFKRNKPSKEEEKQESMPLQEYDPNKIAQNEEDEEEED